MLLAGVFVALRGIAALAEPSQGPVLTAGAISAARVVIVGVTGRPALTPADREVLGRHLDETQVGAVATRPRYVGDCAAAGWATLGAGRRTAVGNRCAPEVVGGRVADWAGYSAAAAANRGDARLGTLADSVPGCTAAVGPGAALAAAHGDGSLDAAADPSGFLASGLPLACPVTLVDAGALSDRIVAELAGREDVTLIVTGVGPAPGSADPALQLIYRFPTATPGLLTSESTRRDGVVTLTDLTRTLIEFGRQGQPGPPVPVDGSPLQVRPAPLTLPAIDQHIRSVAALSAGVLTAYQALAAGGAVLFVVVVASLATRRCGVARAILTFGIVLPAILVLTGAVPWWEAARPGLVLVAVIAAWSVILTAGAILLGRLARAPAAIAGAGLVVAAFTVDAALGGVMQPGSVLNSRPVFALRWYGFGNVTFATYATAGLILAGYLAGRLLAAGRRTAALVAVAGIGFGIVICEGWPTMGADFGGVVALTPAVLWLLLALSGGRVSGARLVLLGLGGVVAVLGISVLDWARGPDARSHLGNFVQRVLDGDALDVVARKAAASSDTIVHPSGVIALVLGILAWTMIFGSAVPRLRQGFPTIWPVAVAVLSVAVLGTLLNDAGISVWMAATALMTMTVAWFWVRGRSAAR